MNVTAKHIVLYVILLGAACLLSTKAYSQPGDTARVDIPMPHSMFGTMGLPDDMSGFPSHHSSILMPQHNKLMLYKALELPQAERPFGKPDKPILNIKFYNPKQELPPYVYAAMLAGAFFNNQVLPIPKEQELKIMNDIYKRPDLNVSGFTEQYPQQTPVPYRPTP